MKIIMAMTTMMMIIKTIMMKTMIMMKMIFFYLKGKQQGWTLESNLSCTGGRQGASPLHQHNPLF